jgi:hypothetical protein
LPCKKISGEPICDRPGCYEPPRLSPRTPASYCGQECYRAMRRVHDRERKWLSRQRETIRRQRRQEYEAARQKRRQARATSNGTIPGSEDTTTSSPLESAVGCYSLAAKQGLTSALPLAREVAADDPKTPAGYRPRSPPSS